MKRKLLIDEQIEAVKAIEYLTVSQQQDKMKMFLNRYSKLLVAKVDGRIDNRTIKVVRPSKES